MSSPWYGMTPVAKRSRSALKMNADPLLFSPDDAAGKVTVIGFHQKYEALGNADRGNHVEGRAAAGGRGHHES